jgi:serine/threonine-protein kinase
LKRFLLLVVKVVALTCSLLLTVALSTWITVSMAFVGRNVVVPEITGRGVEEAREILGNQGLRLQVEGERHSEREPAGVIFYQQPLTGTTLKKGRTVRVVVSLGIRTRRIPRLAGTEFEEAVTRLQADGMRMGSVTWIHSLEVPENRVVAQEPEGGLRAARSDRVDLLVSLGPRRWRFVMPDMTGHPDAVVTDLLEKYGFRIGARETRYVMGTRGGIVIGQYPPAGSEIAQGSAVNLVVSRDIGEERFEGVRTEDLMRKRGRP